MVFNSGVVVAVSEVSTDTWQLIWRIPPSQRISAGELMDMALYQLSRVVHCLWSFMYIPPPSDSYTYEPISTF